MNVNKVTYIAQELIRAAAKSTGNEALTQASDELEECLEATDNLGITGSGDENDVVEWDGIVANICK